MKISINFELPLWLNCNQMNIKVLISIKYEWNTILWVIIRHYYLSKSIPAAKSQNFVETLGPQKPMLTKFWEFEFLLSEKKVIDITRKKIKLGHIIFIHKCYYEIVDKIVKQPKK